MQFGGQPTPWSETEIEGLRLRSVSQILIQEIGAAGPENAEDSARRACGVIQRQADQIVSADARIAELDRECGALREFALEIMECWPHGDVDGCDLEIAAFKHGLIAMKDPKPTEPCGECCACSGYPTPEEWAEGINCYVRTPLLTGKIDAARANGGEG